LAHHHHVPSTGWILYASTAITLVFTVLEVVTGFRSHSLALLSDAGHNFTDALALILAAFGYYLQSKPANSVKTYGYQRAGVIAAFLNASTLILISIGITWEAVSRLIHPELPDDLTMMWVAGVGLLVNGAIVAALHRGHEHDLNIRAAVIHMAGDAVGAVAIILGAVAIHYTGVSYVDPVLSIVLAIFIVYTGWDIAGESLNILLEGLPRGLELPQIAKAIGAIDGVLDVHDLHVWSLGSNTHALSSHILIEDMPPSASENILKRINEALCELGIHHSTIQFEHMPCVLSDSGCHMVADHRHAGHNHG
jgi:cobalt-zinc-cadmium efflux system protein